MKKGFSLAEMMVALAVMGIIAAVTIPIISNTNSKNLKTLYKSAYTNTQIVINELINDISLYPKGEITDGTLCSNFFAKVNTITTASCSSSTIPGTPNFTTSNGMRWYGMDANFSDCPTMDVDLPAGDCIKVSIDVDGEGKGRNSNDAPHDTRDILNFYIYNTGKITVPYDSDDVDVEYTYLTN